MKSCIYIDDASSLSDVLGTSFRVTASLVTRTVPITAREAWASDRLLQQQEGGSKACQVTAVPIPTACMLRELHVFQRVAHAPAAQSSTQHPVSCIEHQLSSYQLTREHASNGQSAVTLLMFMGFTADLSLPFCRLGAAASV